MKLSTALIQYVGINAKELNLTTDKFRCAGKADITSESGSISIGTISQIDDISLDLTTNSGRIVLDNSEVMSPYKHSVSENSQGEIAITTDSSDITVFRSATDKATDREA